MTLGMLEVSNLDEERRKLLRLAGCCSSESEHSKVIPCALHSL